MRSGMSWYVEAEKDLCAKVDVLTVTGEWSSVQLRWSNYSENRTGVLLSVRCTSDIPSGFQSTIR